MREGGERLKLILPGGERRDYPLPIGATCIGPREEKDITLSFAGIAAYLGCIVCDASGCRIIDLSTGKGSRVNGRLIAANAAHRLLLDDDLEIGLTCCIWRVHSSDYIRGTPLRCISARHTNKGSF